MSKFSFNLTSAQAEVFAADIMATSARVPLADVSATIRLFGIRQAAMLLESPSGFRDEVFDGPYLAPTDDDDPRVMAWIGVATTGRTVDMTPDGSGGYTVSGDYGLRTLSAAESYCWESQQKLPDGWHQIAGRRELDGVLLVEKTSSTLIDGCIDYAVNGDRPVERDEKRKETDCSDRPAVKRPRKVAPL